MKRTGKWGSLSQGNYLGILDNLQSSVFCESSNKRKWAEWQGKKGSSNEDIKDGD